MAPKQSRHDGGADLALRQQLAEIKKVSLESVGRIRMTPEKMPSLVDVGVILTGKTASNVARDLQVILDKHPDLTQKVSQIKFGGRGNQDTPVPKNLATLIEIIFLLPVALQQRCDSRRLRSSCATWAATFPSSMKSSA